MGELRSLPVVALALSTRGSRESRESARRPTATPIEHLVVVIGENHRFDDLFGIYRPRPGRDAQLAGGCPLTQQPRHPLNATQSTS